MAFLLFLRALPISIGAMLIMREICHFVADTGVTASELRLEDVSSQGQLFGATLLARESLTKLAIEL
jgi:hypothetical protein